MCNVTFQAAASNQGAELEALRAQVARLQAEKNDLVAMNSELQLKAEQGSLDDDFIEVIRVSVSCKTRPITQRNMYLNCFIQDFVELCKFEN